MLRNAIASALLLGVTGAGAFTDCTVKPLTGTGAAIAEEGSNPVASRDFVFAGFTEKHHVGVAAAKDGRAPGAPVLLYDGDGTPKLLRLAALGSQVYAVWLLQTEGKGSRRIVFDVSRKNGAAGSWAAPMDLGPSDSKIAQLSADGRNVHIVYMIDDAAYAVSSADAGRSFSAPELLGPAAGELVVAGLGPDVYVSWVVRAGRPEVMMAVSNDGGKTFGVRNLSAGRPAAAGEPILARSPDGKRVSLVWRESEPQAGIYLQTTDRGRNWSTPLVIDQPARQFMVVDSGKSVVVSYLKREKIDHRHDWQVQVATSADGGKSFGDVQNLTGPTGISELVDDDFRPIPWLRPDGSYRLTGMKADGIYVWSGRDGHIEPPVFLGQGTLASPAADAAAWLSPAGVVNFAACR